MLLLYAIYCKFSLIFVEDSNDFFFYSLGGSNMGQNVELRRTRDLDLWPFDIENGSRVSRVMGFPPANFQLATPSVLDLGSGTGQTDRQIDR